MDLDTKKNLASNWFKTLQNALCESIIKLENSKTEFKSTTWKRNKKKEEGGGEYRILKDGIVFDKVGVNFSKVYGKFPKRFQKNILGAKKNPNFWASGISVVMHMKNPLIPAMHFNTRYICTTQDWFGGGMDVTPSKKDELEKKEFIFEKIIKGKIKKKWTVKDKEIQYIKRGRYTEFNLLYDRGTKFGLQTGGNIDGILMSLPPLAKWK